MFEFILERYNYWISIFLMLTGLYIVISRGNLVKTLIGLNLFQTSVFIFYISIGKIAGGTAPILLEQDQKITHGDGHGDAAAGSHNTEVSHTDGSNDLGEVLAASANTPDSHAEPTMPGLHETPDTTSQNSLTTQTPEGHSVETMPDLHDAPEMPHTEGLDNVAGAAPDMAEVIYTNPLPHVLILTAIVVGVATTAVGLALAVRIREAYGTIEEDELELADLESEFGDDLTTDGVIA